MTKKQTIQQKQRPTLTTNNLADLSRYFIASETQETDDASVKPTAQEKKIAFNEFRNGTYQIVSLMAFFIGIGKEHFGNGDAPFLEESYIALDKIKEARIIRNLCQIRAAMERNYTAIVNEFRLNVKNIGSIPELIPTEAVQGLANDGVRLYKSKPEIDEYLISINMEISNRINTISSLFPEWIKWDYIKPIFIMPNGTKKEGIRKAGEYYNIDRRRYPFHCWINWDAVSVGIESKGNILYNDEKFVCLLYERHEDRFENLSLVRDAGNQTMRNLGNHLEHSKKCVIVVDCENSDAVKLAAALSSLPANHLSSIIKVLLFDSEYTTDQWKTFVDKALHMAVYEKASIELEQRTRRKLIRNRRYS